MPYGWEPPSVQSVNRIGDFTNSLAPIMKRPLHILSDGSLVAVLPQQNATTSQYGTKNDVNTVEVWYSPADRSSWTKKATYALPVDHDVPSTSHFHCGSVLLNDGSVFFAWVQVGQTGLYGCVFTKTGGSSWSAPSGYETIFEPSARYPYRLDLDINRANNRVFIGWQYRGTNSNSTDTIGVDVIARLGVNSYSFISGAYDLAGNAQAKNATEDFTMAIDPSSTSANTRLVYCVTAVSETNDYGDMIIWRVVRNSDNATIGAGNYQTINVGRAASRRSNWLWANAAGEWTLIGVGGSGSGGEGWVYRFKTTSAVSSTTQAFSQVTSLTYSPLKFYVNRSNSLYSDVAVTYANNKFTLLIHDTSTAYNVPGKITGSSVEFENFTYPWDNQRMWFEFNPTGRASAPASGLYGGTRDADATNMHDTVIAYFNRTSMSNSDAAWTHQWNRASRAPASVVPGLNSVQNTGLPTLAIYADLDQKWCRTAIRPKWQIAKDAAFTTSLVEHTKAAGTRVDGTNVDNSFSYIADQLPLNKALPSGSWYIRAAQLDSFDTQGAWTSPQQFTVSHPPFASPVSPAGGTTLQYGTVGQVTFAWTFGDGYAYDTQTAYRIVIEQNNEVGTPVLDTGKVVTSDRFATISIPTLAKNVQLRWRVQLWDVDDVSGNLSPYALFMVADPPTIAITSPASGSIVDNARVSVSWTYSDPTDSTQQAYRLVFLQGGNAIFDTSWKTGSATIFQADSFLLANVSSYSIVLYVRNQIGLEVSTSCAFTTQWLAPTNPDISNLFVDTTYYDRREYGYVLLSWNNQGADPDFLSWRIYRRFNLPQTASISDKGIDWELIHEEFSVSPPLGAPTYRYFDYTAPSGYEVHYMITQTAMRFGAVLESRKLSLADVGKVVELYSGAYWLIDPDADGDPDDAIRLPGATADSYKDEYETEEMFIIGRGRHVEIGDHHGYSGTLSLPLRFIPGSLASDGPRRQKLDLERFKAKRKAVFLRSPFGDVFLANTGDITFDRIPGVGSSEFIDVSFPYTEVFK